jgi:ADP-ribose pyrophosphatase
MTLNDTTTTRLPDHLRAWHVPWPAYRPVDVTPPELRPGEGLAASVAEGWAEPHPDPAGLPDIAARQAAALIPYSLDEAGRPLNPSGRTGRIGRDLGRWGENAAADPIVVAGHGPDRQVLLIRRSDCGQWAIPGGMVDPGETAPAALVRELNEETGVDLARMAPTILGRSHVADPRETDWAWVATTAALFQLPDQVAATAGDDAADDAADARWFPFPDLDGLDKAIAHAGGVLYEVHRPLLAAALAWLDGRLELSGRAYGVEVDWIGEDGGMVAYGHVEPRRFLAAANRWARESSGGGLREASMFNETYADALSGVRHAWAVRLPKCDCAFGERRGERGEWGCRRPGDHDPEPYPEMWALRIDGVTADTPDAFPITLLWG